MYFQPPPPREPKAPVAAAPSPPPAPPVAVEAQAPPVPEAVAAPVETAAPEAKVAPPNIRGSFRIFRLAGTDVCVHWSWFVAAYFLIQDRPIPYSSMMWHVAEYVAGFGLVLLHEMGHVLACRQVGGAADRVVLWPLGGLAFVAPPPRPGATLWTVVAGPLVNLVLAPALILLAFLTAPVAEGEADTDLNMLFNVLAWFNLVMLVFNLLPIFPMDGGRILQSALWYWLGRAKAMAVSAGVGVVAGAALGSLAVMTGEWWLAVVSGFLVLGALGGVAHSRVIARLTDAERRTDRHCPNCHSAAPIGGFWRCTRCLKWCDPFADATACEKGGEHATNEACPDCGRQLSRSDWLAVAPTE